MAGIDVVFTGLMLICVAGQNDCPTGEDGNTAWVIKASKGTVDTPVKICGRKSQEETKLVLSFSKKVFCPAVDCYPLYCTTKDDDVTCDVPGGEVCVTSDQPDATRNKLILSKNGILSLPNIDEIDNRFNGIRGEFLATFSNVPTRLHFKMGTLRSADYWKDGDKKLVRWGRSRNFSEGRLPRYLSDRLIASYEPATYLKVKGCGSYPANIDLLLTPSLPSPSITFRNEAAVSAEQDGKKAFDQLTYLLWYYKAAKWDTPTGDCPLFTELTDAIILRCARNGKNCADNAAARDSVYWPPMLRSNN